MELTAGNSMNIVLLPDKYSIYKFENDHALPDWIFSSDFYSITKTKEEISVVAVKTDPDPKGIIFNSDWRILKIAGPMDLSLVGVIAEISAILRIEKVPVFIVSTYDTDYILVKQKDLNTGIKALEEKGHSISF